MSATVQLAQSGSSAYYDQARHGDLSAVRSYMDAPRSVRWFMVCVHADAGELIDVWARDRREAGAVARAAIAADYEPDCSVVKIEAA